MPRINLLPWREALRQKRKKEFALAALMAVLVGAGLTMGTKLYYKGEIANQDARNNLLRTEIAELDKQIEEIEGFESQRDRLLDRMEIIDQLQRSRPEAVHLMDELVEILPPGTYLTEVTQQDRRIEVRGTTQASGRIATMMRNTDSSEWLRNPTLGPIVTTEAGAASQGQFLLRFEQIPMADEEEAIR